jgi:RNA recognition motif-containing protein
MIKGFAFVEFDTPESAKKALKTLVVEKSRLRQDMDPGELLSVKTFINEQAMEKEAAVKKEVKS